MDHIPLSFLIGILVFLIIVSGFFSGSETGLMSLNRYRLRNLVNKKHRGATLAQKLLDSPERLIGLILLGNNAVNILASAIATIIGLRLMGEAGIAVATIVLTVIILVFAEVTPKTLAALHPERYALPASFLLTLLLKLFYPVVWFINQITNLLLRLLGIPKQARNITRLSRDELRIVVNEAGSMIPRRHQEMLLGILDLEQISIDEIMIPRNEIVGIDLEDDWETVVKQLSESQHTRLPVYEGDIDHIVGMLHLRNALALFNQKSFDVDDLHKIIRDAYYVPAGTPLNTQLLNFQKEKRRIALVVNEYGDIQGLITLEDILEEIVGEFTTDPAASSKDIYQQEDGSYLINGSITIRELNKALGWNLSAEGPKTLNGVILEYLEQIPDPGTSLMLEQYPIEITQSNINVVKTIRYNPAWNAKQQVDKEENKQIEPQTD
ncbi:Putative membrane protein YfjD [hydrothermal vent metagenome]|uniref:Membrane protein YfjD n=1 Tax=hydrothermal vent metagenome TaxID=652676 RepID=A0A3B1BLJ7_9ZZZZ